MVRIKAYDATEARVEEAEERARVERRRSMGLQPKVQMGEGELVLLAPDVAGRLRALGHGRQFSPSILAWLNANVNAYRSARALAVGAAEQFDLPVDADLLVAAQKAWS